MRTYIGGIVVALVCTLGLAARAGAVSPAAKCEAGKLKAVGKKALCLGKEAAKQVAGGTPDFPKCGTKFSDKFATLESAAGPGVCPTEGDAAAIEERVDTLAAAITAELNGVRFIDNGDGTVSDTQTRLMWEKKDNLGSGANLSDPHDADNQYKWSTTGISPDGTAFTDFLNQLNNGTSADGTTISGCFAGYCDWRLPTISELEGIVDLTAPGCNGGNPCIDAAFGPTAATGGDTYWSSTAVSAHPTDAWIVFFHSGTKSSNAKTFFGTKVRAVRGGS